MSLYLGRMGRSLAYRGVFVVTTPRLQGVNEESPCLHAQHGVVHMGLR